MKRSLRILAIITAVLLVLSLCACNNSKSGGNASAKYGTLIYGDTDLSDYIKLGEYKGLSVDTSSEEFKKAYESVKEKDISDNEITDKAYNGTVKDGDTANIDYVGKKDGVAFEGGSAQDHDLIIGSHSFIDGFEDGLIGKKIGDTVDLNLTFPKDYGSAELAGQAVVFTVKINYVKNSDSVDMKNHYSELGFNSFEDYDADVKDRATKNLLFEKVLENSSIVEYPEKDRKILIDAVYEYYDTYYQKNYNTDFETVLKQNNTDRAGFESQMKESSDSQMKDQMIYYGILQKEGLKAEYELTEKEKFGQDVLEEITKVQNVVRDFLYDNAKIK